MHIFDNLSPKNLINAIPFLKSQNSDLLGLSSEFLKSKLLLSEENSDIIRLSRGEGKKFVLDSIINFPNIIFDWGEKSMQSKEMEKMVCDIKIAIVAMNNAVQISLYSYQVLGERNAQLAVVKEHETFIKQVLLKEIKHKGNKQLAWKLICSSGNSGLIPQDFGLLPTKLLVSCKAFIENKNENSANYLEGKSND